MSDVRQYAIMTRSKVKGAKVTWCWKLEIFQFSKSVSCDIDKEQ